MTDNQRVKLIGIIVIVLLVAGGTAGVIAVRNQEQTSPTPTPPAQTAQDETPVTPAPDQSSDSDYNNGSYTAAADYSTPEGQERIGVTATLANDIVTAISIDDSAVYSREAQEYVALFSSGVASQVVGKNVDEVYLTRVSGSSLTSSGFNQALEMIKNEAAR